MGDKDQTIILKKVRITDYKSIRSAEFDVDRDVTCLVGKNESGKTATLESIYRLLPIVKEHGSFDVTDDYPRADVEEYNQAIDDGNKHTVVIEAQYELPSSLVDQIKAEFGTGVLTDNSLTLSKAYDNSLYVRVPVNSEVACRKLAAEANLPNDLREAARSSKSLGDLSKTLAEYEAARTEDVEAAKAEARTITDEPQKQSAIAAADKLAAPPQVRKLAQVIQRIIHDRGLNLHIWEQHVKDQMPVFLYFDEYYQMKGHLNIEMLKERQAANQLLDSDRPMLGLIELARLNLDQLLNTARTETLNNKLEGASNHLSRQILKFWSQNKHLRVRFDVRPARPGDPEGMRTGTNLWGRVDDSAHFVSTRLGTRSKGFIWYFSFLAWFSQQKQKNVPIILLLDEPDLFLHALAQGDLLNYIEKELAPHHQVIYTSHSPFMIDPERFGRVRIVEDKSLDADDQLPEEQRGTKILFNSLEASDDSLLPLQGALGYDIAQTLFVGPNSLIVEGISDLLYIQCLTRVLEQQGRNGLSAKWTITPIGGADKVPTFVALLGAQKKMKLATLIDLAAGAKQRIDNLYKRKLLKKKNVLTSADFTGKSESDIEDMFEEDFYLRLVNGEYAANLRNPITTADIAGHQDRVLVRIEEHLKSNAMSGATFNHYRPARYFLENEETLKSDLSASTLDRFEKAFSALNGLL